jgi:hypothetical protein
MEAYFVFETLFRSLGAILEADRRVGDDGEVSVGKAVSV